MKKFNFLLLLALLVSFVSCSDDKDDTPEILKKNGVFVVNSGGNNKGNRTLSFLDVEKDSIYNEIFKTANNRPVGDVAQHMTIIDNKGYLAVNGSLKVEVFNIQTTKQIATIDNFPKKPRCIIKTNDNKAYVGQATFFPSGGIISIIDTENNVILDTISTGNKPVNDMVMSNDKIFAINWSKGNTTVQVIDINSNKVIKTIEVGPDPKNAVKDANGNIWVVVTGGYYYPAYPCAYEANGKIVRINATTLEIDQEYVFPNLHDHPQIIRTSGNGKEIFYTFNNSIYKMSIDSNALPSSALLSLGEKSILYNFDINPLTSNIYVCDALDYNQNGVLVIYDKTGQKLKSFGTGIIPNQICFTKSF